MSFTHDKEYTDAFSKFVAEVDEAEALPCTCTDILCSRCQRFIDAIKILEKKDDDR